jgi:hypothetical protein
MSAFRILSDFIFCTSPNMPEHEQLNIRNLVPTMTLSDTDGMLEMRCRYLLNQLLTQPCPFSANTTDVPEFPSRNGPQRLVAAATRQPKRREKVVLEPGHSPLDWARLTTSGKDLRVSSLYVRTQYIDLFSLTLVIT